MTAISNEMPAPDAVLDTINDYVVQLGEYFSQHNITYSVTCNVAAGISVDSRVWTAGVQPDQTMFIGSAVKTFMLAEYLRSDLSEMAVMNIDDSVRSISSTVFGDQTFAGEPRPDMKLDGETLARSVLEAMITHSDNTATDAVLAAVGADNVRELISDVGLTSVRIPEFDAPIVLLSRVRAGRRCQLGNAETIRGQSTQQAECDQRCAVHACLRVGHGALV